MEQNNGIDNMQSMLEKLEKAKILAEMINKEKTSDNETKAESNTMDMEKMMKAYDMARKFQSILNVDENEDNKKQNDEKINSEQTTYKACSNDRLESEFFAACESPALQSMKAALPFLEFPYRRNLAIFIKLIEIQKLLEAYSNAFVVFEEQTGADWRRAMISFMRPHLDEPRRRMMDTMLRFLEMRDLCFRMKEGFF